MIAPTPGMAADSGGTCDPGDPGPPPKSTRAISLRVLQDQLAACARAGRCGPEISSLYGLTRLDGFVLDPDNRDIVLLGGTSANLPPLFIDDFMIALRALLLKFAKRNGNTLTYSFPGISIDPIPETMRRMDAIWRSMAANADEAEMDRVIDRWRTVCESPQQVRIVGIPPSRFAMTMLESDYRMKQLVDGSARPLPNLPSILEEEEKAAIDAARGGKAVASESYNRFWFVAGVCVQSTGKTTTVLDRCDVKLLTEREKTTASGERVGAGIRDPFAERFRCDMSRLYRDLAAVDPVYRRLEALYRWMAIARLLIDSKAAERAGADLTLLTDSLRLSPADVPATVPGRFAVASATITGGKTTHILRLPSCGGVDMAYRAGSIPLGRRYAAQADDLGVKALAIRPRPGDAKAAWSIPA